MPVVATGQVHLTSKGGLTLALPSTVTAERLTRPWLTHTARLANGREKLVAGPFPRPFDVLIRGVVYDSDALGNEEFAADLTAVLMDGPVEVRTTGASADRFVLAVPSEDTLNDLGLGKWSGVSLRLHSLHPWVVGEAVTITRSGITTSPTYWTTPAIQGDLPVEPVLQFEFNAGASTTNPEVVNTTGETQEVMVPANFVSGDVLTIDTETMRVYDDSGESYLHNVSEAFLLGGFKLRPGANSLSIYGSGQVAMDLSITYRPRWI